MQSSPNKDELARRAGNKPAHNRTYIAIRVYTNAWNPKREISFGHVNNLTDELVTD